MFIKFGYIHKLFNPALIRNIELHGACIFIRYGGNTPSTIYGYLNHNEEIKFPSHESATKEFERVSQILVKEKEKESQSQQMK